MVLVVVLKARAESFDEETFKRLSPTERISLAVSCLQVRERLLDNFTYKLVLKTSNFRANGQHEGDFPELQYTFVRSEDKLFIHGQRIAWDGKLLEDFTDAWDGRECHNRVKPIQGGRDCIVIAGDEPSAVQFVSYNLLLGYRAPELPISLSRWLQSSTGTINTSVEVSIDQAIRKPLLMVAVTGGTSIHRRVWLDPKRGYLPVRYEYRDGIRDFADKDPSNWWWVALDEAKQFGDVWIPMKATLQSGCRSCDGMTQQKYEVQQFSLEKPASEDLTLPIPPGIRIVDGIRHQTYEIQKDGSKRFFPLYNGAVGKLISVEEQAAAEAAATQAATQPTTKPVAN
jgi:hypothetical protein